MNVTHPVRQAAIECKDYVVDLRRRLHQAPELSYREQGTAALIKQELDRMGVPWEPAGEQGVVATLVGRHTDAMVALRADMDALPIQEKNEHLPYRSQVPGVMHACGHDGHVAMLLAAAKILMQFRAELNGTVKLCFQQAEEQGGGTAELLAHLSAHPVKSVFAIHLWSEIESGRICAQPGPRMAACDNFEITIDGVGCHGATPQRGIDPIVTAAALVNNVSALMAREIDPAHAAALTFGKFQSGHAANVIPDRAVLAGSIRTTHEADQIHLQGALRRMVEHTAATFRAQASLTIRRGGPVLINEASSSALAARCVGELFGADCLIDFPALMVSENFGDFLAHYPGMMALVGARNEACGASFPHHHPEFNIDENALHMGAALHAQYALQSLTVDGP
jgi:amidohydrolase